jgi:hypothetical protein
MKSQRCRRFHTASSVLFVVVSLLFGALQVALGEAESDADHQKRLESHKELFRFHPDVQVIGPTTFPRPTDFRSRDDKSQQRDTDTTQAKLVPHMKPVLGKHRADRDAVFALAAELDLRYYMIFVQSLRRTGFDGDIVLSVSPLDLKNEQVYDFFSSDPGIVVYVPTLSCFNFEGEEVDSVKGGMRLCKVPHLYARQDIDGSITPVDDPRPARTVAVTRYEIYWLMLLNYNTDRWMLLVDSRDTYFQSNPFAAVPRKTDPTGNSGLLYFYGENAESTRIGLSKMNSKWLTNAYGEFVANCLKDKPIICSGATMGEQVALETYLRAMVAESDDTQVVIVGADQGFHNFLYYSHKLRNANAIHSIVVFDQGTGIVNNMGAMRTKDLKEWGNGKIYEETDEPNGKKGVRVLNWDGSVSPVVHQYDRHHVLSSFLLRRRGAEFEQEFKAKKAAAKTM